MSTVDENDKPPVRRPARTLPGAKRATLNQEPPRSRFQPRVITPDTTAHDVSEPVTPTTPVDAAADLQKLTPEPEAPVSAGAVAPPAGNRRPVTRTVPAEPKVFKEQGEKEAPATWGRKRAIVRTLSLGLAHVQPGQEELAFRGQQRLIRTAIFPRTVRIVVANPKGGVGKTPTSVILGGMIAEQGRSVCIYDAADAKNTLTERSERPVMGHQVRCISQVEADPEAYRQISLLGPALAKQSSYADVLSSLQEREFEGDSVERVQWVLDRTHQFTVADTGNVPHSAAFEAAIALADMLVIPTTVTATAVDKALELVARLQDDLTANAVVLVMRSGGPETPGLYAQLPDLFKGVGLEALTDIPFDREIGKGTSINTRKLTRASRLAWTGAAAAAVGNTRIKEQ